jgi:hypothetical protein
MLQAGFYFYGPGGFWPKEKVQKDKQRSTIHTRTTKDRVTRTPLKTGGELRCSGRLINSCSTSGKIYGRHHDLVDRYGISVTNDHGYVPLVVSTSRFFPHSRFITGFVTRLTRRVPLVEQELINLPEHLSSPPVFSWVRVTRSLVNIFINTVIH